MMELVVRPNVAQAIPYPAPERAAAVEAFREYFALMRGWTGTRKAVAVSVDGAVAVANRAGYIHAELGAAGGPRIQARLINLLEPQEGDPLLVRLEHPGAGGGWVVLDSNAVEQTLRVCTLAGGRVWLTSSGDLFRVDGLTGTRTTDASPGSQMRLGLPQDAVVMGGVALYYSSDMVNFSQVVAEDDIYDEVEPSGHQSLTLDAERPARQNLYHLRYNQMTTQPDDLGIREEILEAVLAEYTITPGTYSAGDLATHPHSFYVQYGAIKVDISTDGGASFNSYVLDYLGELLAWRLKPELNATIVNSYGDWYNEFGYCPCENPNVIGPGEQAIVHWVLTEDETAWDSIQVCPECEDFPYVEGIEVAAFPQPISMGVAAKEDGAGAYVFFMASNLDAQTTTGEYLSPLGWRPAVPGDSFGNEQWNFTLFVWDVANGGAATRKAFVQGPFDVGSFALSDIWQFERAVVNALDSNVVFVLYSTENESAEPVLGVKQLDFDAFTFTDLNAPFAPFFQFVQGAGPVPSKTMFVTQSGALFVHLGKNDFSEYVIWRYKDAAWTSTDVTAHGGGVLTYSYADDRLYMLFDNGERGISDDDGDTWSFGTVIYDNVMNGVSAVDAY